MKKIKIGISSCLLGEKVRYDGGDRLDGYITDILGHYFEWVAVCPEVEYGLPVPRECMQLIGDAASPRIVTMTAGVDHTDGMKKWAEGKLRQLEKEDLCGFIFKSKSPSCGVGGIEVHAAPGAPSIKVPGIFGGAFMRYFPLVPVVDDGGLHNPLPRETFIEQVFVYKRKKTHAKGGV